MLWEIKGDTIFPPYVALYSVDFFSTTMTPEEALHKYWRYDSFRPLQREIIESVLSGHDTLALLPTGGGKSICYQIPAVINEGITVVISPLIALMADQVRMLSEKHIKAAYITSGMSKHQVDVTLNNSVFGKIKLLYVSPERLQNRTFIDHFRQMKVSLIAVDEAHCISQWGYDFRPPYLEIAKVRQYHPDVPVIALTATATPDVVGDIEDKLNFKDGKLFQNSFARPNIVYTVRHTDDKEGTLLRIIRGVGCCGIVYVRNRRRTQEISRLLNDNDIAAAAYHAGIPVKERIQSQQDWMASSKGVMVATNAFGMGIDKPDVRFVIHLDLPESPEAYFQEAGRAGRDGLKAYAVLVYSDGDCIKLRNDIERDFPPLSLIKNTYKALCNFYQLPVGAGEGSRFPFNIEEICNNYGLDMYSFYRSLSFLEREGLVSMPEQNELLSKVYINVDKEELYRVQMSDKTTGDMLEAMLRLYGGLFTDFTPISESVIAKRCGLETVKVANMLTELNRLEIITYQPKMLKPQIVFNSQRIDVRDLNISEDNYKKLKELAVKRRESMIDYAVSDDKCRSVWLLDYFGERNAMNCGCCDYCLSKTRTSVESLESKVLETMKEGKATIKQLAESMDGVEPHQLTAAVRRLLDKGKLAMDEDFNLMLTPEK